jgi:hypothetical protein
LPPPYDPGAQSPRVRAGLEKGAPRAPNRIPETTKAYPRKSLCFIKPLNHIKG